MNLTPKQIAVACGARIDRATANADGLNQAMHLYNIDTQRRVVMFLANIGHETGGLKYLTELWDPTPAQRRYERNFSMPWPSTSAEARLPAFAANKLAYGLGNTEKGDGALFRGHGMLQNTGRYNHARVRDRLRKRFPDLQVPDFEREPDKLALPQWAALAAGDYIDMKDGNAVADAGEFDPYCDLINLGRVTAAIGDSSGWADRLALYNAGLVVIP